MGLPVWSSVGYGSEEKPSTSKVEPTATRRSPIRRRSSATRLGYIRDPETGDVRAFRRFASRRVVPARAIPPQAPVPQHRRPYRPFVHSPLVPSIPPGLDEQLQVTIDALERACAESLRISSDASAILRPNSRLSLRDLRSQIAQASEQYCHAMRGHITTLEQWELVLRRNDEGHTAASHVNFTDDIVSIIRSCDDGLRNLRDLHAHLLEESRQDTSSGFNEPQPPSPTQVELRHSTNEPPALQQTRGSAPERRRILADVRRDNHWSIAPLGRPLNESGGLGDRTRSASPDNDPDAWDTMRMTLEPDDHLPTADSSFTSAAASASFSAPTDTSRSTTESDSANSSRTSLTVPPADDTACESDDNQSEQLYHALRRLDRYNDAAFPEVIPSPLIPRNPTSSGHARPSNDDRERLSRGVRRHLPWIEDGPASTWTPRIGLDTPPPEPRSSERLASAMDPVSSSGSDFQYSFMPRSQSPLGITPYHQPSSEPPTSLETTDDSDSALRRRSGTMLSPWIRTTHTPRQAVSSRRAAHLRASPPDSFTARASSEDRRSNAHPRLADSIPAVVRLALRYAERVSSLDDPHADPDLEHMRTMLQSLASDGYVNMNDDDMWIGAGLASMVAENNAPRSTNRTPPTQERERL